MNDVQNAFASRGLARPAEGRVLAGVCAGLGRRFGLGPWTARLLFVLILTLAPGSVVVVYPILWILMPADRETRALPPAAGPVAPPLA